MEKSIYTREHASVTQLLRAARKRSGLTQVELAERLGLTQSHLSKIERGEARIDIVQLRTYCHKVGTTLGEFVADLERAISRHK